MASCVMTRILLVVAALLATAHGARAGLRVRPATGARAALRFSPRADARMGFLDDIKAAASKITASGTRPPAAVKMPDVVIKEDYTLAIAFVVGGVVLTSLGSPFLWGAGALPGVLILLLGVLFTVQTGRIRFCFDGEAFELKTQAGADTDGASGGLQSAGENIVVGGENRWKYTSFVNWEFFPKGWLEKGLPPILVYFKESQTPAEQWNKGPGQSANSAEALAKGAVPGQVHFFPALCDCKQMKAEFEKRGCAKLV